MKKSTLVAMILVLLLVLLSACSASSTMEKNPFDGRIHRYQVDLWYSVCVDNVTGVCYLQYVTGSGCDITVMVDANGKPLIYKGE